ncbi:hypothetical protein ONE63_001039 [Megalurothrips usitatus]|uniref:Uncharacterized protein n=1 Tax=Megalurothrips usitatus TaxID=439358 RepID=A0AAV7XI41_9NEOP|nr:hypothetical protein ONE63_001039 [Megalurothrips usitatus]
MRSSRLLAAVLLARAGLGVLQPGLSDLPAEADCALAVLSPQLQPAGPYAARLVVTGNARWLNTFLARLPAVATVSSLSIGHDAFSGGPASALYDVSTPSSLVLVAADTPSDLAAAAGAMFLPDLTRALLWTSMWNTPSAADLSRITSVLPFPCLLDVRMAVTSEDGVTHFYRLTNTTCGRRGGWAAPMDVWSPVAGASRLQRVPALWPRPCHAWQPPPAGHPHTFITLVDDLMTDSTISTVDRVLDSVEALGQRFLRRTVRSPAVPALLPLLLGCRLSGLAYSRPLTPLLHVGTAAYPWRMLGSVVAVPAGLGPTVSPLIAVTTEFTNGLWLATAGAALTVAAAHTAARICQPSSGRGGWVTSWSLLQTLAPLVSQTPTVRPRGALRPLYASWLFVCIVVTAAYQVHF